MATYAKLEAIGNALKLIAAIQEHPACGAVFNIPSSSSITGEQTRECVNLAPTTLKDLYGAIDMVNDLKEKERCWFFKNEDSGVVGYADPDDYPTADVANAKFNESHVGLFHVYFKDSKGKINRCFGESIPADFE